MPDFAGFLYDDAGVARDLAADTVAIFPRNTATASTGTGSATALTQTDANGSWESLTVADGLYDVRITDATSVRWRKADERVQLREIWVQELQVVNQTDAVSNQLLLLRGNNTTRAANDEIYVSMSMEDSGGGETEFARISAVGTTVTATTEIGAIDVDLMDAGTLQAFFRLQPGNIRFDRGAAITAADYAVGRDADGTNQLHYNTPTGAGFEWSVNDAAQLTLNSAGVLNVLATTGNSLIVDTNTLVVDATNNQVRIGNATTRQVASTFGLEASNSSMYFWSSSASIDNRMWDFVTVSEQLQFRVVLDDASSANNWLTVDRTGITVDVINFPGGNVGIRTTTFGTSAAGVLGIANATAPTTGPADTIQIYSTDDAAGHTIPSFFCEGTNVLATGQADSASSVRVKVRINGTVVTLLGI